jgi:hypothetical protein
MSFKERYHFSKLNTHEDLISKMTRLEAEMAEELGEEVRLIAYTPNTGRDTAGETQCRADLNGE